MTDFRKKTIVKIVYGFLALFFIVTMGLTFSGITSGGGTLTSSKTIAKAGPISVSLNTINIEYNRIVENNRSILQYLDNKEVMKTAIERALNQEIIQYTAKKWKILPGKKTKRDYILGDESVRTAFKGEDINDPVYIRQYINYFKRQPSQAAMMEAGMIRHLISLIHNFVIADAELITDAETQLDYQVKNETVRVRFVYIKEDPMHQEKTRTSLTVGSNFKARADKIGFMSAAASMGLSVKTTGDFYFGGAVMQTDMSNYYTNVSGTLDFYKEALTTPVGKTSKVIDFLNASVCLYVLSHKKVDMAVNIKDRQKYYDERFYYRERSGANQRKNAYREWIIAKRQSLKPVIKWEQLGYKEESKKNKKDKTAQTNTQSSSVVD